jgi:hypothetical protein
VAHQYPTRGLTLKQAGIMLIVSGVVVGVVRFAMKGGRWESGLLYVSGLFAIGGLLLTIVGIVRKA